MSNSESKSKITLALSMTVFGTIGLFRSFIELPSAFLAMLRGIIGGTFLIFFVIVIKRNKFSKDAIKKNFIILLVSGALIGFNWVFLFESYIYTSIPTATLCYYMAPTFIILASPIVLKEKLTIKKEICAAVSVLGMVLVSGIIGSEFSGTDNIKGILFGLAAAALYASVIILNKKLKDINAFDKTTIQLLTAGVTIIPYVFFTTDFKSLKTDIIQIVLILIICIFHTGLAYAMYFGSMDNLKAQTIALFSYIDPVVAIILSQLLIWLPFDLLNDESPMGWMSAIGAVLILGSALIGETDFKQVKKHV